MLTLGIVSTIADCRDSIEKFISYHKAIGFSHFYLFIDDNDIETKKVVEHHTNVFTFLKDENLTSLWEKIPSYTPLKEQNLVDKEVMARQELNFFVAYQMARETGIDWLLHIDADELFFPNGADTQDHFKSLQLNNFRSITYLNYESISTLLHTETIYHSSEHFKVNFFKNHHWFFSEQQEKFIKNASWLNEKYFNYYQNGKSAVSTYGKSVTFYDVHSIFGDGRRKLGSRTEPIILHFPCARYSDFFNKYSRLGKFSDLWRGNLRAGEYIHDIHLKARDFFQAHIDHHDLLIEFYQRHFLLNETQIQQLIAHSLASKIDFHLDILKEEN